MMGPAAGQRLVGWRVASSRLSCLVALALLAGCDDSHSPSTTSTRPDGAAPRASVALKVLVVNNPALAESIGRLRGEWAERGGGTLVTEAKSWSEVDNADALDADLVVFPARYLGQLVQANRLRPIRGSTLNGREYDADDVLSLARRKLAKFGLRTFALPLSVQLPLVAYRSTSPEAKGRQPPQSRASFLDHAARGESVVWPPRSDLENWPAIMLLARAAGYAQHPQQEFTLFDLQSMKPRIAEPPFVRALEEWKRDKLPPDAENSAPADRPLRWAELPGPAEVYDRVSDSWVPIGGVARPTSILAGGELLAVTASTRNAASAFDLAAWLTSPEISRQLAPVGKGMLPVRRSQLATVGGWVDLPAGHADGAQLAQVVQTALERDDAFVVPRIAGVDEYLAALSDAADEALGGDATSADALNAVAAKWDAITERLGRGSQRRAYLDDLGLDAP